MATHPDGDLAGRRLDYTRGGLSDADAGGDPLELFRRWYAEAEAADEIGEANAMVLATAGLDGAPASRTVLLKGLDDGLWFFTHRDSDKGRELAAWPRCALLFPWYALQRQVRVVGVAAELDRTASEAYFASRPRESQLGAWASQEAGGQSRVVADRAALDAAYERVTARFDGAEVPCPEGWGGYRVRPASYEFWQGRTGRLHDRVRFSQGEDGTWTRVRLAP